MNINKITRLINELKEEVGKNEVLINTCTGSNFWAKPKHVDVWSVCDGIHLPLEEFQKHFKKSECLDIPFQTESNELCTHYYTAVYNDVIEVLFYTVSYFKPADWGATK